MSYVVDAVRSFTIAVYLSRLGIDLLMFGLASANFRASLNNASFSSGPQ